MGIAARHRPAAIQGVGSLQSEATTCAHRPIITAALLQGPRRCLPLELRRAGTRHLITVSVFLLLIAISRACALHPSQGQAPDNPFTKEPQMSIYQDPATIPSLARLHSYIESIETIIAETEGKGDRQFEMRLYDYLGEAMQELEYRHDPHKRTLDQQVCLIANS